MQSYLSTFNDIKSARAASFKGQYGLDMKTGEGLGAVIIKTLKPKWTTDPQHELLNSNGLFFSVWVDAECEAQSIARYNLHAKKLRFIRGEKFANREFVRSFRLQAQDDMKGFPNWNYPKGPITLFEGSFPLAELKDETDKVLENFAKMTPLLERLLEG